jgi:hypothetical protein
VAPSRSNLVLNVAFQEITKRRNRSRWRAGTSINRTSGKGTIKSAWDCRGGMGVIDSGLLQGKNRKGDAQGEEERTSELHREQQIRLSGNRGQLRLIPLICKNSPDSKMFHYCPCYYFFNLENVVSESYIYT